MGSSYGSLAGMGIASSLTFLLIIAAFVLSIVVYIKFAGAKADKISKESWSWHRFFTFDTILVSGILKYLYILSAFEIIAFGLGMLIGSMAMGGAWGVVAGLIGSLLFIAFSELLCRVTFEFMMLLVKLTENSRVIKNAIVGEGGSESLPTHGFVGVSGMDSVAAFASPQVASPVVAPAPVASATATPDTAWTCPTCGRVNARGLFCAGCGGPRG